MLPYFLFSLHHPRLGISHLRSLLPLSQNHAIQSIPCILTHHLLDAQWPSEWTNSTFILLDSSYSKFLTSAIVKLLEINSCVYDLIQFTAKEK